MTEKQKIFVVVGGSGGHVFPGCNLADHLIKSNFDVKILCDKRGFKFLGPTTVYAHMQACGMVNDHCIDCPCHEKVSKKMRNFKI